MSIYESIKVRAACELLNVDVRTARLYANIHQLTGCGSRPYIPSNLQAETAMGRNPLARLAAKTKYVARQIDDVIHFDHDAQFRAPLLADYYQRILPKVRQVTLRDIIRAVMK